MLYGSDASDISEDDNSIAPRAFEATSHAPALAQGDGSWSLRAALEAMSTSRQHGSDVASQAQRSRRDTNASDLLVLSHGTPSYSRTAARTAVPLEGGVSATLPTLPAGQALQWQWTPQEIAAYHTDRDQPNGGARYLQPIVRAQTPQRQTLLTTQPSLGLRSEPYAHVALIPGQALTAFSPQVHTTASDGENARVRHHAHTFGDVMGQKMRGEGWSEQGAADPDARITENLHNQFQGWGRAASTADLARLGAGNSSPGLP